MTEREKNEKKKEYLNRYKNAVQKYKSLQEQERQFREEMDGPQGMEYSDMPKAHRQSDLSDYMVRLDKILSKITSKKKELQELRLDIEDKIADMMDGTQSRLLYLRYIKFLKWEDICVEIGYSWKQTHKIHSKALANFEIPKEYMEVHT